MTDARAESFLADVLALEGENADTVAEGVHVALADCEQIYKAQEVNRRMKDKAPMRVMRYVALGSSKRFSGERERRRQSI